MLTRNRFTRREILRATSGSFAGVCALASSVRLGVGAEEENSRTIPAVPGKLEIQWRRRVKVGDEFKSVDETVLWNASETAIIICDMWADHPCKMAALRAGRMAPRMNEVVSLARDHGVAIIHAPSGGVKYYEDTPFRTRMKNARYSKPPVPIQGWCYFNAEHEGPFPIVDDVKRFGANVTGCDDPVPKKQPDFDRRQHGAIRIIGYDGVSADGQEIFNFLEQEGRQNVVLMGVHTNMCVLGRPFGIRQQKYLGKNVVLCRDLTDAMYDPRDPPHVSHARGLELVIEHIEKHWCPSTLGASLTKVKAETAGPDG